MVLYRDLSIQIIPALGPKVREYYLHWAIRIPRVRDGKSTTLRGVHAGRMLLKLSKLG